jgi:cobalt-zinc-cadmium efflux system outer membrane protein
MRRRCVSGLFAGLVAISGCLYPMAQQVDHSIAESAMLRRDPEPASHAGRPWPGAKDEPGTSAPAPGEKGKAALLTIPPDLPGGNVPPISLPPIRAGNEAARAKAIGTLYPAPSSLGEDPPDAPGPDGHPLTLSDLQDLALKNNPTIRQAAARVEEARGAAIQAGLPPNPTVGYEGDTMNTTGGAGYQGGFVEQKVITMGKLPLARAVAAFDLENAVIAKRRAETDLLARVRGGYFGVLVAQESIRLNRALVKFTNNVYQVYADRLKRGFARPYEPMYLRALAGQARGSLIQSRNRRTAAWKQLAASIGLPTMPPTQLAGRLDIAIPDFDQACVLQKILATHTDVLTATTSLRQAEFQLKLARLTPIPDVNLRVMVQRDTSGPPFGTSPSVVMSMPIPVWDRNQGHIMQAQAALVRLHGEIPRVQNELARTLAEAFERYDNSRQLLAIHRDQVLPDLVRVYHGTYARFRDEPGPPVGSPPGLTDLVVAEQNLATAIGTYITTLGQAWQGVVDVADLLQTPDLFGVQGGCCRVAEIPDLEKLLLPTPAEAKP